jgi:hypothetical protein
MDILTDDEINSLVSKSKIAAKYNQNIDSESAYEILNAKLAQAAQKNEEVIAEQQETKVNKNEKSTLDQILSSPITKQVGRTAAQIITRSLLGALGLGGKSTKKTGSWF